MPRRRQTLSNVSRFYFHDSPNLRKDSRKPIIINGKGRRFPTGEGTDNFKSGGRSFSRYHTTQDKRNAVRVKRTQWEKVKIPLNINVPRVALVGPNR